MAKGARTKEDAARQDDDEPFDPSRIRIESRSATMAEMVDRIGLGEIPLGWDEHSTLKGRPSPDTWNDLRQSRFIESMLIRLPLPHFYFDSTDENRWIVIDGFQRLSALKQFAVDKTLNLDGLEYLPQYNEMNWDTLPRSMKRRILETSVIACFLEAGTPPNICKNIYERINASRLNRIIYHIRLPKEKG